jgi:hypothetical protein
MEEKLLCSRCKESKPTSDFYKRNDRKRGFYNKCKTCHDAVVTANRTKSPEAYRHFRNVRFIRDYGLSLDQIDALKKIQNNCCDICGVSFDMVTPHVDHTHDNQDKVRGLLCGSCNRGIGLLKDSPDVLLKAAKYLLDNAQTLVTIL